MSTLTPREQAAERDFLLMDRVLREGRNALADGGAGIAALLGSNDQIIAVARLRSEE